MNGTVLRTGTMLQQQLQAWLDPSPLVCGSALLLSAKALV